VCGYLQKSTGSLGFGALRTVEVFAAVAAIAETMAVAVLPAEEGGKQSFLALEKA